MQHNQPSKRTVLVFSDLHKLWAFSQSLSTHNLEINTRLKTLACDCTETDIARAIKDYGAALYEEVSHRNSEASYWVRKYKDSK